MTEAGREEDEGGRQGQAGEGRGGRQPGVSESLWEASNALVRRCIASRLVEGTAHVAVQQAARHCSNVMVVAGGARCGVHVTRRAACVPQAEARPSSIEPHHKCRTACRIRNQQHACWPTQALVERQRSVIPTQHSSSSVCNRGQGMQHYVRLP